MKKAVKIFGLLILTSFVFFMVGCKKDEPQNTDTPYVEPDNGETTMALIFGDEPAYFGYYQAVFDDNDFPYYFSFAAVGMDSNKQLTLPQIQIQLTYDTAASASNSRWNVPVFYYSENAERYAQVKPEWVAKEFHYFQFTKFETNPIVMSFEASATMYSNYEYRHDSIPEAELTTKELLMRAKNIHFVDGSLRAK